MRDEIRSRPLRRLHLLLPARGPRKARFFNWLTIRDQAESVGADVRRIRAHPLVSPAVSLSGYIYDVRTGRLVEVPGAVSPGVPFAGA